MSAPAEAIENLLAGCGEYRLQAFVACSGLALLFALAAVALAGPSVAAWPSASVVPTAVLGVQPQLLHMALLGGVFACFSAAFAVLAAIKVPFPGKERCIPILRGARAVGLVLVCAGCLLPALLVAAMAANAG